MSITLPPLPPLPHPEFELTHGYREVVAENYAIAYANAAVEADRASRVPMTRKQCEDLIGGWNASTYSTLYALVRVVESHLNGAKP